MPTSTFSFFRSLPVIRTYDCVIRQRCQSYPTECVLCAARDKWSGTGCQQYIPPCCQCSRQTTVPLRPGPAIHFAWVGDLDGDGNTWTNSSNTRQWMAVLDGQTGALKSYVTIPQNCSSVGPLACNLGSGYLNGTSPSIIGKAL